MLDNSNWLEVKDSFKKDLLLKTFFEPISRKILKVCANEPHTITEILRTSGESQTTVYRRIHELIERQFLVLYDKIGSNRGHELQRYLATVKTFKIEMNGFNDVKVMLFHNPEMIIKLKT